MAEYVCRHCSKPFKRRGKKAAKCCSRECHHASRPASQFDFAAWYEKNRADQNAKRRAWAKANPDKRREITAKWRAKNRASIAADAFKRRALKGQATAEELSAIMSAANGRCVYCGGPSERLEFDHVEPVSAGGSGDPENLLPACRSCNASKHNRPVEEWLFDKFGLEGLCRAISMLENRKAVEAYYPGVRIVEVR